MLTQEQHMENWNYYGDERVNAREATAILYLEDDEIELPYKWAVCDLCNGKGTHVNPSIDAGGLTAEDFHDDPDFAENYRSGMFDQTCNACKGRTTIREVDVDALSDEYREAWEAQLREEDNDRACAIAEMRMGA